MNRNMMDHQQQQQKERMQRRMTIHQRRISIFMIWLELWFIKELQIGVIIMRLLRTEWVTEGEKSNGTSLMIKMSSKGIIITFKRKHLVDRILSNYVMNHQIKNLIIGRIIRGEI